MHWKKSQKSFSYHLHIFFWDKFTTIYLVSIEKYVVQYPVVGWKCEKWILYTTFQPLIFCSKAYVFWKLPSACRTQSQVINHWFCVPLLLVFEQATQNSKTRQILLLETQFCSNSNFEICIWTRLEPNKTRILSYLTKFCQNLILKASYYCCLNLQRFSNQSFEAQGNLISTNYDFGLALTFTFLRVIGGVVSTNVVSGWLNTLTANNLQCKLLSRKQFLAFYGFKFHFSSKSWNLVQIQFL